MRLVVAALLLLIQLRPLAGAVVCLEQTTAREECAMPEHGLAVTNPSDGAQSMPAGCQGTALCSPAGMALAPTAVRLAPVHAPAAFAAGLEPTRRSGPSLAPPFHPPRV